MLEPNTLKSIGAEAPSASILTRTLSFDYVGTLEYKYTRKFPLRGHCLAPPAEDNVEKREKFWVGRNYGLRMDGQMWNLK